MNNISNNKLKLLFLKLRQKAKIIKKDIAALYLAYKRPDTPFYAKLISLLVIGYALSPIDLIPDFIPILGYLDDIILLPLGIMLAVKLIPSSILEECRQQSNDIFKEGKPKNWIAGLAIIFIWILSIIILLKKIF